MWEQSVFDIILLTDKTVQTVCHINHYLKQSIMIPVCLAQSNDALERHSASRSVIYQLSRQLMLKKHFACELQLFAYKENKTAKP